MEIKRINIIGFGNVGQNLFEHLKTRLEIITVYTKTIKDELVLKTNNRLVNDLNLLSEEVDLNIIAVTDSAIKLVAMKLSKEIPAVHTSGGTALSILSHFNSSGILYPLQTFSKGISIEFQDVPFFIEANDVVFEKNLISFVKNNFSKKVFISDSDSRKHVHLSAVITSNFLTYFMAVADSVLKNKQIPLSVLGPLLHEAIRKSIDSNPSKAITGPAIRGDFELLSNYAAMIEDDEFKEVFRIINDLIAKRRFTVL